MTDWSKPTTASTYANYTTELINRDASLAKQFDSALVSDTNVLTDTIRWNSSSKIWERWSGTAWGALAATYGINVSQLLGATWAAPGTIGSTTPSTGAFTTLSASTCTFSNQVNLTGAGTSTIHTTDSSGMYLDAQTNGGMYIQTDGNFIFRGSSGTSYAARGTWSSTGLAVTGTLSASGNAVLGTGTGYAGTNNTNTIGVSGNSLTYNYGGANYLNARGTGSTLDVGGVAGTTLSVNNTVIVNATSTGLAVTGTGSFTGILTAPTAAAGTDTTQVATTAFVQAASKITLATQQATTSGTSIDFTSIPATVKRITVMFSDVSTNGSSLPIIQIGDSGGIEITGYTGAAGYTTAQEALTSGFKLSTNMASYVVLSGSLTLTLMDSSTNKWMVHGVIARTDSTQINWCAGYKALSGVLDRIRLTTANGTDAFDLGSINITYE